MLPPGVSADYDFVSYDYGAPGRDKVGEAPGAQLPGGVLEVDREGRTGGGAMSGAGGASEASLRNWRSGLGLGRILTSHWRCIGAALLPHSGCIAWLLAYRVLALRNVAELDLASLKKVPVSVCPVPSRCPYSSSLVPVPVWCTSLPYQCEAPVCSARVYHHHHHHHHSRAPTVQYRSSSHALPVQCHRSTCTGIPSWDAAIATAWWRSAGHLARLTEREPDRWGGIATSRRGAMVA